LNPRPSPEDLPRCYATYSTHEAPTAEPSLPVARPFAGLRDAIRFIILCGHYGYTHLHQRHRFCRLAPALAHVPGLRYRAVFDDLRERFPRYSGDPTALLLDVGCGRGDYLRRMHGLGWTVMGVEPDPIAATLAEKAGIQVFRGTLHAACLPDEIADQVTMQHVLEHLPDPCEVITEIFRLLKPGGRLVLYTPNTRSLGHRVFRGSWRGLEPPRHLILHSPRSLGRLLARAPFQRLRIRTVSRLAKQIYEDSFATQRQSAGRRAGDRLRRSGFAVAEALLCAVGLGFGEEIEAVAWKR
jgi:SAM-dependent methyltransferase